MAYEWRNGFFWVGPGLEPTAGETKEEYAARVATEQEPSVTLLIVKDEEIIGKEKDPEEQEPTEEELVSKPDNKWLLYAAIAIVAIIIIAWVARR